MNIIKKIQSEIPSDVLTYRMIQTIFDDKSEDALKSILKRSCQKGELLRIKKGIYLVGEDDRKFGFNHFTVANQMVFPSYVSMESALSYYNLIPEAVYTTTSITPKPTREYDTLIGRYVYNHLKEKYFNFGFYQVSESEGISFLIGTPLKSLIDYIVITGKKYKTIEDIENDLRLEWKDLLAYKEFDHLKALQHMLKIFKSHRLQTILKEMVKSL